MTTRRTFLFQVVPAVAAVTVLGSKAVADECTRDGKDPVAKSLKYNPDTTKVDKKDVIKGKTHAPSQNCANCASYVKESKTCMMFPSKCTVTEQGWCNGWSEKK